MQSTKLSAPYLLMLMLCLGSCRPEGRLWVSPGSESTGGIKRSETQAKNLESPTAKTLNATSATSNINDYIKQIKRCYQDILNRGQQLQGRVLIKLSVKSDGTVDKIALERDGMDSLRFNYCVIHGLEDLAFIPPPREDIIIEIPLDLSLVNAPSSQQHEQANSDPKDKNPSKAIIESSPSSASP
tara:strand:+ start:49 stop:603 length:555 start_codon:yes stop_codon:yes gene_type:complete